MNNFGVSTASSSLILALGSSVFRVLLGNFLAISVCSKLLVPNLAFWASKAQKCRVGKQLAGFKL